MIWTLLFACGPKKPVDTSPKVGWHQEEGWTLSCYFPPEYDKLNELDRREARENSMTAMLEQWGGSRSDGVSIDSGIIEDVETVLLSQPTKIEDLSRRNLDQCSQVASGASSLDSWSSWVATLPSSLTVGECSTHFVDTVFDYLNISILFPFVRAISFELAGQKKINIKLQKEVLGSMWKVM